MTFSAGELVDGLFVPIQAEPFKAGKNLVHGILGGTGAVCILDAQKKLSARVAGIEPVKQRGARAADV